MKAFILISFMYREKSQSLFIMNFLWLYVELYFLYIAALIFLLLLCMNKAFSTTGFMKVFYTL
ncbi:hypothetical protein DXA38_14635 [[Clostridium] innocuum]|uniref:Uncharacterized protein n=1 Tax=Clostridium innocuum TaxID=1522 RepID=A0A3E2VU89_CLOIN|nr:hypothetical protein DXA38_14635 [[Clostridium] innocuum]RHV60112.1 hypothetical protein DXB22_19015 [Clostridiaceae bacterium OM02-2AC]